MASVKMHKDRTVKHSPIKVSITDKAWNAEVDLDVFMDAILDQVGNPSTLLTRKGLKDRVDAAKDEYLRMMREEIAKKV